MDFEATRRALHNGTGIQRQNDNLRFLEPLAVRLQSDPRSATQLTTIADYWSLRAHSAFDAGRTAEAYISARRALDAASATAPNAIRTARIYRIAAAAAHKSDRQTEALRFADQAVALGALSDPLTLARGNFTMLALRSAIRQLGDNATEILTDANLDVVAQRHSPSLAAAGLLLRVKAYLSTEEPSYSLAERDLRSAQAFMLLEPQVRRIQEMQLAETTIRLAIATRDLGMAMTGLSDLRALAANTSNWKVRADTAQSIIESSFSYGKRVREKR